MPSSTQLMHDPALYEHFAALNPCFEAINEHVIRVVRRARSKKGKPLTILDLGAGTGLQAQMLVREFPNAHIFAVEQDKTFFAYLEEQSSAYSNIVPIHGDVISFKAKSKVDIIIIRFVYHHIPDKLKARFLRNVSANLKRGGLLIIIEECLDEYSKEVEREARENEYHHYRIKLAKLTCDKEYVEYQTKVFSLNLCPYKVSQTILKQQLLKAGVEVTECSLVRTNAPIDYDLLGHVIVTAQHKG